MLTVDPTATVSPHARFYEETVVVGAHSRIDDGVVITGNVEIGHHVHIGAHCLITGGNGVRIGDYTGLSPFVAVMTATDDFSGRSMSNPTVPDKFKPGLKKGRVAIGRNVLIGLHSTVMPNVTINDGVGVGAYSLVKDNCEADTLYAGVPAKKIRERSKESWNLIREFES